MADTLTPDSQNSQALGGDSGSVVPPAGEVEQEALLQELAALSPIEYDRRREAAARKLRIRVQTLDTEVDLRRPQPEWPGAEEPTGTERRGVPRGTLKPLDPAPTAALPGGWSFLASEACRSNHGLRLTAYLRREETACGPRTWSPGRAEEHAEALTFFAEKAALDVARLEAPLAGLLLSVEGVLREMATRTSQDDKAASLPGSAVLFEDLEPWPEPVDGATLLTALVETCTRYVVLPAGGADLLALWVVHSYALDAAQVTPILALVSPQKRCGKTTCLSVLQALVNRPLPGANLTPAVVFRSIEAFHPTLLVDEADTFMRDNEELRGVLNSGHTRGMAYVLRMVPVGDGFEPRRFSTWCPKAIAGIGTLPHTLHDRSIVLTLQRKTKAERVSRWREAYRAALLPLRQQCLAWAREHLETLRLAEPDVSEALHDRAADNWEPLLAIADAVGGEWPERARKAIAALEGLRPEEDAVAITLLRDIQGIFADQTGPDADKLPSKTLLDRLSGMEERPWTEWGRARKPITARQVATLIKPFGILSKTIRLSGDVTQKGYELSDFVETFSRYLGSLSVTASQISNDMDLREKSIRHTQGTVTDEKTRNPASDNGCDAVTDRRGTAEKFLQKSGEAAGWRQEL